MRLTCPICGSRDRREFYYKGDAVELDRPDQGASDAAWDDYLHNRDNHAGEVLDLWHHAAGCGAWLVVTRNTLTHKVTRCELTGKAKA